MSKSKAKKPHRDEAAAKDAPAANGEHDMNVDGAVPEAGGLDELRCELQATHDRLLRAQADADNYQKRVTRERAEDRRYAHLPLLRELLAVRDNLHRAVEAAESADDSAGLLEGVQLVAQQLATVFEQHDCREVDALGAQFDPNLHEAVSTQPSEEHPAGIITAVFRVGFQLHDRVVRPAQVVVSTGPVSDAEEKDAE